MIKQDHILRFNNLSQFPSLTHGFSTTFFGNMRYSRDEYQNAMQKFSEAVGFSPSQLVRVDQVHSNIVYFATENDRGQMIAETDGLMTKNTNVFLGIITADCLPILIFDPKRKLVAAVHAGWRGLFSEIIKVAVSDFIAKGSDPKDLVVGIGPSIRVCCYNVDEEFVERFREKFGDVEQFIERRDGKIFFNLQKVAKEQLLAVGVLENAIEDADYCTFDHTDVYSCRREGKDFGEMMGVIGLV